MSSKNRLDDAKKISEDKGRFVRSTGRGPQPLPKEKGEVKKDTGSFAKSVSRRAGRFLK